jgi:phosphohistidine phosphatase
MSKLFIIRHAIAEERADFSKTGLPDAQRPLTVEGRKKMKKIASYLYERYPDVDHFFQSPLTRSQQTVEILRQEYKKSTVSTTEHLRPGSSFESLVKELKTYRKGHIAIVGHEDHLSHFTCFLMTGKMDGAFLKYKKGGIAVLDFLGDIRPGEGQLQFLITPKIIHC